MAVDQNSRDSLGQSYRELMAHLVFLVLLASGITAATADEIKNGFRLTHALVPAEQILSGGPNRLAKGEPHMYDAANYVVIDEVKKLPLKVSDIYRRLTT